jgi:hypothetical protein
MRRSKIQGRRELYIKAGIECSKLASHAHSWHYTIFCRENSLQQLYIKGGFACVGGGAYMTLHSESTAFLYSA